jgi:hypothetical protein
MATVALSSEVALWCSRCRPVTGRSFSKCWATTLKIQEEGSLLKLNDYLVLVVVPKGGGTLDPHWNWEARLPTTLKNILTCPKMEDGNFHHVNTFREGLEFGVIPFHSEALTGTDWASGRTRDCKADVAKIRDRTNQFEAWVFVKYVVDIEELPPKDEPLPEEWYGSEIFKYLHVFLVEHLPGSCTGTGPEQARFNNWHCWLYRMFEKYFPLLKHFQEPTLKLNFLISNQRVKTDRRRNHAKRRLATQATPRAKRSKSR